MRYDDVTTLNSLALRVVEDIEATEWVWLLSVSYWRTAAITRLRRQRYGSRHWLPTVRHVVTGLCYYCLFITRYARHNTLLSYHAYGLFG